MSCTACYSHATIVNCEGCSLDSWKKEVTEVTRSVVFSHVDYELMRYESPSKGTYNKLVNVLFKPAALMSMSREEIMGILSSDSI